jgi:hypothetical protein
VNVLKNQAGMSKMKSVFKTKSISKDKETSRDGDFHPRELPSELQMFQRLPWYDQIIYVVMCPVHFFIYLIPSFEKYQT